MELAGTDWNTVIGTIGGGPLIVLLVQHLKQFARGIPWMGKTEGCSPWPLVCDVLAVGLVVSLWKQGNLTDLTGIAASDLTLTTVGMIALTFGSAVTKLYDVTLSGGESPLAGLAAALRRAPEPELEEPTPSPFVVGWNPQTGTWQRLERVAPVHAGMPDVEPSGRAE